jgi:Leucine-rich repeat (LRR) protein
MASSSTSTLSDEVMWEELPNEILLQVMGHVMPHWDWRKCWWGPLRGVSRQWRAVHDAGCQWLRLFDGVTDEAMHALCGRLPALTYLNLWEVKSLTADGLRAVGGLTTLTYLELTECSGVTNAVLRELRGLTALTELVLYHCSDVTDVGLRELRGLTKLTTLDLHDSSHVTDVGLRELRELTALTTLALSYCTKVTNVGLQNLTSLTALTKLYLYDTSTTQAGRNALKAALPALTIYY